MDGADQPELCILKVEPMPGFQKVMYPFAFDQCSGKYGSKNRRALSRLKTIYIYAAR